MPRPAAEPAASGEQPPADDAAPADAAPADEQPAAGQPEPASNGNQASA
jgi:hypothetical protein